MPLPFHRTFSLALVAVATASVLAVQASSPIVEPASALDPCVAHPTEPKEYCPVEIAQTVRFSSTKGADCSLTIRAASGRADGSYLAQTDNRFRGRIICSSYMEGIVADLQMQDLATKNRYFGNTIACQPCAGNTIVESNGSTPVLFPSVFELTLTLGVYLPVGDTWQVIPTPGQGAECLTVNSPELQCTVTQAYSSLPVLADYSMP